MLKTLPAQLYAEGVHGLRGHLAEGLSLQVHDPLLLTLGTVTVGILF